MREEPVELTIRASSMPTAVKCPGSAMLANESYKSFTPTADLGTAVHEVIERYVSGQDWLGDEDLQTVADVYNIEDMDEFTMLCMNAKSMWDNDLGEWFDGDVLTERYIEMSVPSAQLTITGHIDIIGTSLKRKMVRIVDWKTGRLKSDYLPQLFSYAALALSELPDQNKVEVVIAFVRDKTYVRRVVTRSMIAQWFGSVVNRVTSDARQRLYRYGDHCRWCEQYFSCPAMQAIMRSMSLMAEQGIEMPEHFEGEDAGAVWDFHKALLRVHDDFASAVKARVDQSPGDEVSIGGDRVLRIISTFTESIADAVLAWPIVEEMAGEEAMPSIVSISKSKAVKAVREQAPRGKKKAKEEELLQRLTDASAIMVRESTQLREGKAEKSDDE